MTRMLTPVAAVLALATAQMAWTPAAQAQDLWFELYNDSSLTLMEFYVSPTDSDYWGNNLLGADVVFPGEGGEVLISDGQSTCFYDILGVFENGDEAGDYGIDLCELQSYTFY